MKNKVKKVVEYHKGNPLLAKSLKTILGISVLGVFQLPIVAPIAGFSGATTVAMWSFLSTLPLGLAGLIAGTTYLFTVIPSKKYTLLNGKKEGTYEEFDKESGLSLTRKCTYRDGKEDGPCEEFEKGKLVKKYTYQDGKIEGPVEIYEGDNLEGIMTCNGYRYTSDVVFKGNYKDGILDGPYEIYAHNALKEAGVYKNGVIDGVCQTWDYHQRLSTTTFQNGVKEGPYEERAYGGLYESGTYHNGKKEGPFKSYYSKQGELLQDLAMEGSNRNGELDGPYKKWNKKGKLMEKGSYKNGRLDGDWEEYYEDGSLHWKGTFDDGRKDGIWTEYAWDGHTIIGKEQYQKGQEVKSFIDTWKDEERRKIQTEKDEEKRKIQAEQLLSAEEQRKEASRSEAVGNMKGRLQMLSDPAFRKPVGTARTPERQSKLERYVIARRKRDVLYQIFQQAMAGQDEALLAEMKRNISEEKLRELGQKGVKKLSPNDKKLLDELMSAARPYIQHQNNVKMEFRQERAKRKQKTER